jgi:hypothetical protein
MRLKIASSIAIRYACMNYHYAKAVPSVQVAYSVFNDEGDFCGVIAYGLGANPAISAIYSKWSGQVLELVRVALNGKHTVSSAVVSMSLKLLKKDAPLVDLVVSYSDLDQGHLGVLYQATNWVYSGCVEQNNKSYAILKGKKVHPRSIGSKYGTRAIEWLRLNVDPNAEYIETKGKHKYLYPLNRKMRKQIEPLRKSYPKKPHAEVAT